MLCSRNTERKGGGQIFIMAQPIFTVQKPTGSPATKKKNNSEKM